MKYFDCCSNTKSQVGVPEGLSVLGWFRLLIKLDSALSQRKVCAAYFPYKALGLERTQVCLSRRRQQGLASRRSRRTSFYKQDVWDFVKFTKKHSCIFRQDEWSEAIYRICFLYNCGFQWNSSGIVWRTYQQRKILSLPTNKQYVLKSTLWLGPKESLAVYRESVYWFPEIIFVGSW